MHVVYFWGHQETPKISRTCLSQWYPAPFTEDGITFPTAEHYMMYKKASLFGDKEAMKAVLESRTARHAKQVGRKVRNFRKDKWDAVCRDIVAQGNWLKFSQNPKLARYLKGTGNAVIAEASPFDKIWGIGIDRAAAERGDKWQGTNWLGEALMKVREWLRPWHPGN